METWKVLETILGKPLETIVDVVSGKWLCGICPDKQKFWNKDVLIKAAKDKLKEKQ
ncbi:MAG: hypothetical protein ACRCVH_13435 [Vagococcus fluvialis]